MNNTPSYTRELPPEAAYRVFKDGTPILALTDYDCVLCERFTGNGYAYTALNWRTGEKKLMTNRATPLKPGEVDAMVAKMHKSAILGASNRQADKPTKSQITVGKAREITRAVFTKIMPQNGFAERSEQIDLADHILRTIARRGVTLAEAETGTGKTHGYLIPAVIAKRGRLNDYWNTALYPDMQYAEMSKMPIVIATSSIALQRALMAEYIPQLSQMLLDGGVIKEPLTAVLRKGREHYICKKKLHAFLTSVSDRNERERLEILLCRVFDLAEVEGITPKIKQRVCVEGKCYDNCPYSDTCDYLQFRAEAAAPSVDIQVCNHNYLLADTMNRAKKLPALIPNYQMLIMDEAHKFLAAARTMYGSELSRGAIPRLYEKIIAMKYRRDGIEAAAFQTAEKLKSESKRLFTRLLQLATYNDDDEAYRYQITIDEDAARHLRNVREISGRLIDLLNDEVFLLKADELLSWVSRKYHADTTGINLNRVMTFAGSDLKQRVADVHKAIRELPEVQERVATERAKQPRKGGGDNPERQLYRREKSKVMDLIWDRTRLLFKLGNATGASSERVTRLIREITTLHDNAAALAKHKELICWFESDADENKLCAIPKDLGARLFKDQWGKGISTILTSGTMSAAKDFTHIKRTLGLDNLGDKVTETSKPSPFDYQENALLYISEDMLEPDNKSDDYIAAVANEVEKLVRASNGHAAVLFTSYKVMDKVWERIKERRLPQPMFRLDKGGVREIEKFKLSGNGVLFASGALWEGIDIPGDALSLLIIVRLPFAVPDPISEYEQTQYPNFGAYLRGVIIPEMLIKLKQGFGRLIRTVSDTGVVAIIDSRANRRGKYFRYVINALPNMRITGRISDVKAHLLKKKPAGFFR
jgi:Rad3-related DNA helicase